ncbi:MAG: hypothetical protein NDJ90_10815, partial [Oligoflexia bacterium]|nr:hypothetical protein [Oligoflexia bacterium]
MFAASAFSSPSKTLNAPERVPGQLVVKFKDASSRNAQATVYSNLLQRLGGNSVLSVKPFVTDASYQVLSLAKDSDIKAAIDTLSQERTVEIAEPNFIYRISQAGVPNDPDFEKTWGIHNTGQADNSGRQGIAGSDIKVLPLWEQGFRG